MTQMPEPRCGVWLDGKATLCGNPLPCFAHVDCRPLRTGERWSAPWFVGMQGQWARYYTDDTRKSEVMRASSVGVHRYGEETLDVSVAFGGVSDACL